MPQETREADRSHLTPSSTETPAPVKLISPIPMIIFKDVFGQKPPTGAKWPSHAAETLHILSSLSSASNILTTVILDRILVNIFGIYYAKYIYICIYFCVPFLRRFAYVMFLS